MMSGPTGINYLMKLWETRTFYEKENPVKSAPLDQCRDKERNAIEKQVVQVNIIATLLKNTIVFKGT